MSPHRRKLRSYALAIAACGLVTVACLPLQGYLDVANVVMLFLLVVFLVAWKLGRGPALAAAFLSVGLFDFFFVPPRFSLTVSDAQFVLTFAVMLAVGLVTTQLTAALRDQAAAAEDRERRAERLYALARDLAGAATEAQILTAIDDYLSGEGRAGLHRLDTKERLNVPPESALSPLAYSAIRSGEIVSTEHSGGPISALIVPLRARTRTCGVLIIRWTSGAPHARADLMLVASLVALVVERMDHLEAARAADVQMASERLRASVLSALSHDLRTPLTAMVGLADSLAVAKAPASDAMRASAAALRDQAHALANMVANLLDMARLQAGRVRLHREWQLLEDTISAGLQLLAPTLAGRPVTVSLEKDMPLVEFDAVLMERVVYNLLENAAKYSPHAAPIEVRAFVADVGACIEVADRGQGFPPDKIESAFEAFVRGDAESNTPGVGLGLAICRTIVDAHHGSIRAANRPGGGASVIVCLPLGAPPIVEAEPAAEQTP